MSTRQYTLRAVPADLDLFLRRQASRQGKSLNQTILDYLRLSTQLDRQEDNDDFSWIIGANTIEPEVLKAISELKEIDKKKSRI